MRTALDEEVGKTLPAWRAALAADGWVALDLPPGDEALLALGRSLGEPAPARRGGGLIDRLSPRAAQDARPGSLSAEHGFDAFPLHTDTAFWPVPARYIVLRSVGSRHDRPTLLCDSRTLDVPGRLGAVLGSAVWKVSGAGTRFLCSLVARHDADRTCFRFDAGCMRPHNGAAAEAHAALEAALAAAVPIEVRWSPGRAIIVDNWRMLHGRAVRPGTPDPERVLDRLTIK